MKGIPIFPTIRAVKSQLLNWGLNWLTLSLLNLCLLEGLMAKEGEDEEGIYREISSPQVIIQRGWADFLKTYFLALAGFLLSTFVRKYANKSKCTHNKKRAYKTSQDFKILPRVNLIGCQGVKLFLQKDGFRFGR